jgi:hypothetical protein
LLHLPIIRFPRTASTKTVYIYMTIAYQSIIFFLKLTLTQTKYAEN